MVDLKDKIEGSIITRTFNISGVPESVWRDIDSFCKEYYGDVRWNMLFDLYRASKVDYKYEMLFNELDALKVKVSELEGQLASKVVNDSRDKKVFRTFGGE